MTDSDISFTLLKLLAVVVLVFANGFFVAAEFSIVSVRRSRVQELLAEGLSRAQVLKRATDNLDAYLAATQLGITLSSLALGWIGEPAIAHLVAPLLEGLPFGWSDPLSHMIAVIIAFTIITAMHIVLGELAPKSLALQRTEKTALATVRLLEIFLKIFHPAISFLNGIGNLILKMIGLEPGSGEGSHHSNEELKLLFAANQEAGLLEPEQQKLMERVLNIGERRVRDIMTLLPELTWVDVEKSQAEIIHTLRSSRYDQLIVSRGTINEMLGIIRKQDLYDHYVDGKEFALEEALVEPLIVYESMSILKVLDFFKKLPVHMAVVLDEYGEIQGMVTQSDLLSAIAGDLFMTDQDNAEIVVQPNGDFLMDGMISVYEAFEYLGARKVPEGGDFHTLAGFIMFEMGSIPNAGDSMTWGGWLFTIQSIHERRIEKILVSPVADEETDIES